MRPRSAVYLLPALVFVFAWAASAQTDRGTITGTIADPAGAVVPNAAVQAKNAETGTVYQAASSDTGNYTVAALPAGTYELSVTVQGFKKFIRPGIIVEVAGTVRVDATLEVGSTSEAVTVTEAAPLLKTESGDVSYNFETNQLDELPVFTLSGAPPGFGNASGLGNVRNPLAALTLMPGTQFATDNTLRVNGMPSSTQAINIEGQDGTNGQWRQLTQINQVSADAVQELAVQTSNYAAEYGGAGGGYFNFTMKSGTNQLHGSGYDYFVNEALNAGLPFTDAGQTNSLKDGQHIRNPIRQNDYGFTLGGPVVIPKVYNGRNKTFFFFNFEQFRQNSVTVNNVQTVATPAMRNGDFSSALIGVCAGADQQGPICANEIFDPATQRIVNGVAERSPFPNNIIPQNRMDATAAILQNMIPLPNASGLLNNYNVPAYSDYRHTTIPSIKVDQVLTSTMKLAIYFSEIGTVSPQSNGFTQPFTSLQVQDSHAYTTRVNFDETLTPTLLLHVGAGLLFTTNPQTTPTYNQSSSGLFPQGDPYYANQFPYFALGQSFTGGGTGIAMGSFFNATTNDDVKPTFNSSLTWVRGNHTFKLGAQAIFEGIPTVSTSRANGEYEFSNIETSQPTQNGQPFANFLGSGLGYASFFLGLADGLQVGVPADFRLGTHEYAMYIQDSWKVTHKLTIDYGLRWDYSILWKEEHGRLQDASFTTPNPLIGNRLGDVIYGATNNGPLTNAYPYGIGPHLGVAYQITPKTVFRGGASINYASNPDQAGLNTSASDFYSLSPATYGAPVSILQQGNPFGPNNPYGNAPLKWPDFSPHYPTPSAPGVIPPASPFVFLDKNAGRLPRIFQWSVGFQQELTPNMMVDIAYVGNRGVWWPAPLLDGVAYNALTPQFLQSQYGLNVANPVDANLLNTPINNPAVTARFPFLANPNNVYPGFPGGQPLNQALRAFPQWQGVPPFLGPPVGDTWFDSLQVKGTKRFSHGLSAQAIFTWEKDLTNGANAASAYLTPDPPLINDVYNYGLDKQLAGLFDTPLTIAVQDRPIARGA